MERPESVDPTETTSGIDRRNVLRRGAILGGALVWTVPAVQTLSGAAFAAGSPLCEVTLTGTFDPPGPLPKACYTIVANPTPACCQCVADQSATFPLPVAIGICIGTGACTIQSANPC